MYRIDDLQVVVLVDDARALAVGEDDRIGREPGVAAERLRGLGDVVVDVDRGDAE